MLRNQNYRRTSGWTELKAPSGRARAPITWNFDIKKMVCFTFLMFLVNSFQTTCNVNSNMLFLIWTDYLLQMIRLEERGKWK